MSILANLQHLWQKAEVTDPVPQAAKAAGSVSLVPRSASPAVMLMNVCMQCLPQFRHYFAPFGLGFAARSSLALRRSLSTEVSNASWSATYRDKSGLIATPPLRRGLPMKCSIPSIGASGSLGLNVSSIAWYRLHKHSKLLRLGTSSWSKTLARSSTSEIISCSATRALPAGGCVSDRHFVCLLSGPLPYVWMKRISHMAVRGPRIGQSLISICSIEATAEAKVRLRAESLDREHPCILCRRPGCAIAACGSFLLQLEPLLEVDSPHPLESHLLAIETPQSSGPQQHRAPGSRAIETPCAIFLEKSVTCQAPA